MKAFDYQPEYKKTVLSNGVRVITEHHPHSRAVSAGIYVDLGTRDEPEHLGGAAHFVEHMVFKGTKTRTAYDIASTLEAVGGEINAATGRESTSFTAAALREDTELCLDVLSDLVSKAQFLQKDFEKEREVILQEIDMSADQLEEYIFDLYFEEAYRGHKLAKPILGTPESLNSIDREELKRFYQSYYQGENLIVSVSGSVNHDQIVEWLEKNLKFEATPVKRNFRTVTSAQSFKRCVHKPSEQVHVILGLPNSSYNEESRFESYVINAVMGGGMTSKLYQKVREDLGLAYSVYSYLHAFTDSGLMMFYAATTTPNLTEVISIFHEEIRKIKDAGLTEERLEYFKKQVIGNIVLGADDIENRMNSLAVNEMIFGEYRSVDSTLDEITKVNPDSIKAHIDKHFDLDQSGLFLMGDLNEKQSEALLGFDW